MGRPHARREVTQAPIMALNTVSSLLLEPLFKVPLFWLVSERLRNFYMRSCPRQGRGIKILRWAPYPWGIRWHLSSSQKFIHRAGIISSCFLAVSCGLLQIQFSQHWLWLAVVCVLHTDFYIFDFRHLLSLPWLLNHALACTFLTFSLPTVLCADLLHVSAIDLGPSSNTDNRPQDPQGPPLSRAVVEASPYTWHSSWATS